MENLLKSVLKTADSVSVEDESYVILQEIKKYITSMSYLTHKESIKRLEAYIASKYDYEDTVKILSDRGTHTTKNAIKTSVWYANKILKQKLGEDVLTVIKTNPKVIYRRLQLADTGLEDVLLKDTVKALPEFEYLRYDIKDCKYELLFLARFSRASFNYYFSKMDARKLAYLNHILSEPSTDEVQISASINAWLKGRKKVTSSDVDVLFKAQQ